MGIGLTDAELASIRDDIAALLPDTCVIQTITNTADGLGGYTRGTTIAGTVDCRLDAKIINNLRASESMAAGGIQPFHQYILTVPYDTTITTNNQVQKDNEVYNVISVDTEKSWIGSVRVILEIT
jgi:head-tail adaptor